MNSLDMFNLLILLNSVYLKQDIFYESTKIAGF